MSGLHILTALAIGLWAPRLWATGAFAFSKNQDGTFKVAADFNRGRAVIAEQNALDDCRAKGGRACRIVKTVRSGCHSLAANNDGKFAFGVGASQKLAQDKSVRACRAVSPEGGCVVRKSFCDNSDGFIQNDAARRPLQPGPSQFFCRSPKDYMACRSQAQGRSAFGGPNEREQYCRMTFC